MSEKKSCRLCVHWRDQSEVKEKYRQKGVNCDVIMLVAKTKDGYVDRVKTAHAADNPDVCPSWEIDPCFARCPEQEEEER